jgi:hypothetical protein
MTVKEIMTESYTCGYDTKHDDIKFHGKGCAICENGCVWHQMTLTTYDGESYTCGMCNITQSYDDDFPALSRKDNKTDLCSKCGQIEAMVEYNEAIKQ